MPSPLKPSTVTILLPILCHAGYALQHTHHSDDPCAGENSNVAMRECYGREQLRVNADADKLAESIATNLQQESKKPDDDGVIATSLQSSASDLKLSQQAWRSYRDQYCKAVESSWTSGSGAGTAFEACMYELGKTRGKQLRSDFGDWSRQK